MHRGISQAMREFGNCPNIIRDVKTKNIQVHIRKTLQQLIGNKLTRSTRAGDTECMKFGILYRPDKYGKLWQIGEFGLHLQCPWRIVKGNQILVGSDDIYEQPDENAEYDENFDYDVIGANLRDVKMNALTKKKKYIVENVEADELGGFKLFFDDDVTLTVFPAGAYRNEKYSEHWRLLDNREKTKQHFVVSVFGVEYIR